MTKNPCDHRTWTNKEIEEDPEGYLTAQAGQREDQDKERARAEEQRRYERFEEAFTKAGGTKADAEAAYKAHKNEQAATAARRADEAAQRAYEGAVKGAL